MADTAAAIVVKLVLPLKPNISARPKSSTAELTAPSSIYFTADSLLLVFFSIATSAYNDMAVSSIDNSIAMISCAAAVSMAPSVAVKSSAWNSPCNLGKRLT
jgi:hypothetical protein